MKASKNQAILAVAGAGKTESIVDAVAAIRGKRVLVSTYTNRNTRELAKRLRARGVALGTSVEVLPWMTFVLRDWVRPFQTALLGRPHAIRRPFMTNEVPPPRCGVNQRTADYYMSTASAINSQRIAEFGYITDNETEGEVVARLEEIYDHIFLDEFQDLSGYDPALLERLVESDISVTIVGDLRQNVLDTSLPRKYKHLREFERFQKWVYSVFGSAAVAEMSNSVRCDPSICELASSIFNGASPVNASRASTLGHVGVHVIPISGARDYIEKHDAAVLAYNRTNAAAVEHGSMNIRESKGGEFDHVVIFPTESWKKFIRSDFNGKTTSRELLYVGVTRARHSVAFVMD